MSDAYLPHEFQYASAEHQAGTANVGMWLFLATEMLFFGGLFLCWIFSRIWNLDGFDAGARQTELWIGTLNTAILLTSSLAYATGLAAIRRGDARRLVRCCLGAIGLGLAFLVLKFGIEWRDDLSKHLFPTQHPYGVPGPHEAGAKLFYVFYFLGTGLHGVHMLVGIGLVAWIAWRARAGAFSPRSLTAVEMVGLYWSFVDTVWIFLYPLIYLVGRR